MPNWCYNDLRISHEDKSKVDELVKFLEDNEDAEKPEKGLGYFFNPIPADEEENWYQWNVDNLGTKWDFHVQDFSRDDDNEVWCNFDTAWSPPISLYEYLTENGWDVSAQYHEPGMGFVGEYVDGEDSSYDYDFDDEDWSDDVPDHLIEFAGLDEDYENWKEWQEEDDEEEVD